MGDADCGGLGGVDMDGGAAVGHVGRRLGDRGAYACSTGPSCLGAGLDREPVVAAGGTPQKKAWRLGFRVAPGAIRALQVASEVQGPARAVAMRWVLWVAMQVAVGVVKISRFLL